MQIMATTLGELEPAARVRVLRWLQERVQVDSPAVPAQLQAAPVSVGPLSLVPLSLVPAPGAPADEQLAVGELEDFFSPRDARHAEPAPPQAAPQSVTGLLTEFVAEFQNIAREWDDACAQPVETPRPARRLSAVS